ncbi:MAG: translation initiation factor IF-1 [Bdellovibrionales bacterium CG10_big_fil_rev_8_21_14_0_10_45_34]|nr:MAG: translation initiation factor IF-1 [Bdellovibrionales bacterium CG10_big_fil_rev_8_21_14_0_10_45_34]
MSKDDLVTLNGRVSDLTGGGVYKVSLDNGALVNARLCGKMKKFNIKVVVGDSVSVGISPYDATHGLILHRFKALRPQFN